MIPCKKSFTNVIIWKSKKNCTYDFLLQCFWKNGPEAIIDQALELINIFIEGKNGTLVKYKVNILGWPL